MVTSSILKIMINYKCPNCLEAGFKYKLYKLNYLPPSCIFDPRLYPRFNLSLGINKNPLKTSKMLNVDSRKIARAHTLSNVNLMRQNHVWVSPHIAHNSFFTTFATVLEDCRAVGGDPTIVFSAHFPSIRITPLK